MLVATPIISNNGVNSTTSVSIVMVTGPY